MIALEPLNRYENHMINTLARPSRCAKRSARHLGIAADTYHMNIEEADPLQALDRGRRPGSGMSSSATATGSSPVPATSTGPRSSTPSRPSATQTNWPSSAGCPATVDEVLPTSVAADPAAGMDAEPDAGQDTAAATAARSRVLSCPELARARDGALAILYPHQWSWDSHSSRSVCSTGPRAGRERAAEPVRRPVGRRPGATHRLQPGRARGRLLSRAGVLALHDVPGHPRSRPRESSSRRCTRSPRRSDRSVPRTR